MGLLSGLYTAAALAAVGLTRFDDGVAFIWTATGLLIGYLSFRPRRWWPVAVVACFVPGVIVSGTVGLGWAAAVPLGMANVGEAVVAAYLLRRRRDRAPIESLRWFVGFVTVVGIVAPLASATIAGVAVAATKGQPFLDNFVHWYTGHALGNLTCAPVAMLVTSGDVRRWLAEATRAQRVETAGLLALVAAISIGVFAQATLPLLFLPIMPVILATFRIGRFAAAAAIVLVATIGGAATLMGTGPIGLIEGAPGMEMQFLQFYLSCIVLTVLPVTADLSRREQLFRRLRESEARYRALADHSTDIIMNLDVAGRIRFASPSVLQLGGFTPEQLIGTNAVALIAPEFAGVAIEGHQAALQARGEPVRVEYQAIAADGSRRWFESQTRALIDEAGRPDGVITAVRDIDGRKALEAQLSTAALTDVLTGLANRRAFIDTLERHLAQGRPGCVALFDLDHFKSVNDRYGHPAGDAVLRRFAKLAEQAVRGGDLVARIGGEEFAVLLAGASKAQAARVCERLRRSLSDEPIATAIGGPLVRVTASCGVAAIDGRSAADILAAADTALYRAKRMGRDRLSLAA
jgi:diguanylate cyclase (GGDEF)-like protein/PAS domain S-box-containing protein